MDQAVNGMSLFSRLAPTEPESGRSIELQPDRRQIERDLANYVEPLRKAGDSIRRAEEYVGHLEERSDQLLERASHEMKVANARLQATEARAAAAEARAQELEEWIDRIHEVTTEEILAIEAA